MGRVRPYDFVTGIETSTVPNPGTPSAANDTISLGYVNNLSFWAAPVVSVASMRALTAVQRADNQRRVVDATQAVWYFDSASTGVDDGSTILTPNDVPASGRWLIAPGGSGGGGGGGTGIDLVLQKLEQERYQIFTTPIQNSGGLSAAVKPEHKFYEANLLRDYVSGGADMDIVWNGRAVNDADINYDSATGWTAGVGSAAASIGTTSTAGQFTIGTGAVKFDKNGSAVRAGVRYDRTAQTLSLSDQTRAWVYVYLPSITGLTSIYLMIFADTTGNYQTFTQATNHNAGALVVGLNLMLFDVSTGGTAVGTGWDHTKLSRYVEIGVDTTAGGAGQTYTGVAFDALYFSYRYPERLRVDGSEYTVFDNSIRSDIKSAVSNTKHDGPQTLSATVANNIAGGTTGTARGRIMRSTMLIEGDGLIVMDNDSALSGGITTTQDVRTGFVTRGSVSGSMPVVVDVLATQAYPATVIGGSTIGVTDPENTTANLKNGDAIDIFRPFYIDGVASYALQAALSLTADATHSAGVTTLTLTTAGLLVGDIVCKRHINTVGLSMVTESSLENFSSLSLDTAPDGVQLIETGMLYPNSQFVYAHWTLGGNSSAEATRNRRGPGPSLTVGGTLNHGNTFRNGQRATSGWSTVNTLSIPAAAAVGLDGAPSSNTRLQFSAWLNFSTSAVSQWILCKDNSLVSAGGYAIFLNVPGQLLFYIGGVLMLTTAPLPVSVWNHIVVLMESSGAFAIYVNGIRTVAAGTNSMALSGQPFNITGLGTGFSAPLDTTARMADVVAWSNGPALTQSQVLELYNQGQHRILGSGPLQRYKYTATGQTGQRATVKARMTRTTTAVRPIISKIGTIVT